MEINQFQTNIQVFKNDHGKKYWKMELNIIVLECADTPKQNGIAER